MTYYDVQSHGFHNYCNSEILRDLLDKMESIRQVYQIVVITKEQYDDGKLKEQTSQRSLI